jgi:hypothetical protein
LLFHEAQAAEGWDGITEPEPISSLLDTGSVSPAIVFIAVTRQQPVSPPMNENNRANLAILHGEA